MHLLCARHCLVCFAYANLLNGAATLFHYYPIFQMENWNPRRLSDLNQGHTASDWWDYDLNSGRLALKTVPNHSATPPLYGN